MEAGNACFISCRQQCRPLAFRHYNPEEKIDGQTMAAHINAALHDEMLRRKEMLVDQLLTSTQAMSDFAYQWFLDASQVKARADEERRNNESGWQPLQLCKLVGVPLRPPA